MRKPLCIVHLYITDTFCGIVGPLCTDLTVTFFVDLMKKSVLKFQSKWGWFLQMNKAKVLVLSNLAICNICFGIDSYLINSLTRFVLIRIKSVFSAVFTVSSIWHTAYCSLLHHNRFTSQKMKFSIDDFFSKCDKSAVSISFFYYFSLIRCKRLGMNITICIRR